MDDISEEMVANRWMRTHTFKESRPPFPIHPEPCAIGSMCSSIPPAPPFQTLYLSHPTVSPAMPPAAPPQTPYRTRLLPYLDPPHPSLYPQPSPFPSRPLAPSPSSYSPAHLPPPSTTPSFPPHPSLHFPRSLSFLISLARSIPLSFSTSLPARSPSPPSPALTHRLFSRVLSSFPSSLSVSLSLSLCLSLSTSPRDRWP